MSEKMTSTATTENIPSAVPPNVRYQLAPPRGTVITLIPHEPTTRR